LIAGLSLRPLVLVLSLCVVSGSSFPSSLLPEPTASAIRYQNLQDWFWCADQAMGLVVPPFVLFSGLGGRLAERCRRLTGNRWFLAIALFAIAYATIDFLLNLPLAFWEGYVPSIASGSARSRPGFWRLNQSLDHRSTFGGGHSSRGLLRCELRESRQPLRFCALNNYVDEKLIGIVEGGRCRQPQD
jgi:hypothetical protein